MATIPSNRIPTIAPGNLFDSLVSDTYQVRWLTAEDPAYFEALNRPIVDVTVRQLILAKSLDQISLALSHQQLFPFLVQAQVANGSTVANLPVAWIWDMHVSLPSSWENVRLAKIKRMDGVNAGGTDGLTYTGTLRLVFTANAESSTSEVSVFQADYEIDSTLTYQRLRVDIPTTVEESNPISASAAQTVDGFVTYKTLDTTDTTVTELLDVLQPPIGSTPAEYEILDTTAGGTDIDSDFSLVGMSHGTGILVDSATNAISPVDSDINSLVLTLNLPFDPDVTQQSASHPGIIIPSGLFTEFNIVAPAGDEPEGDSSGTYYPVWISKVVRDDTATEDTIKFIFATYNVETASTTTVEFASLTLVRDFGTSRIVSIEPIENLWLNQAGNAEWLQGFGRGHVVLSTKWGSTDDDVDNFFDAMVAVTDDPPEVLFTKAVTRLSAWAISRVPKYTPTEGQWEGLQGSLGSTTPPNSSNRFIVESDQGQGDEIDFDTHAGLPDALRSNPDIGRYGYSGSLAHKMVYLKIESDGTDHQYNTDIRPRLIILYGRDPVMFDWWFDGIVMKFYTGLDASGNDLWVST